MGNTDTTAIAVVLDRSGSMGGLEEATVSGLNQFFRTQRETPGSAFLTLVQFDDLYEVKRNFENLKEVPDLTRADFQPRGSTALLDAIGKTVTDLGNKLASMPEATRPGKVIVVIQTDGFENASKEYSYKRIQDMITHQRGKYAWEFVFLGANQDAIATGAKLGVSSSSSLTYNASVGSTLRSFSVLSSSLDSYRTGATCNAVFDTTARASVLDEDENAAKAVSSSST